MISYLKAMIEIAYDVTTGLLITDVSSDQQCDYGGRLVFVCFEQLCLGTSVLCISFLKKYDKHFHFPNIFVKLNFL